MKYLFILFLIILIYLLYFSITHRYSSFTPLIDPILKKRIDTISLLKNTLCNQDNVCTCNKKIKSYLLSNNVLNPIHKNKIISNSRILTIDKINEQLNTIPDCDDPSKDIDKMTDIVDIIKAITENNDTFKTITDSFELFLDDYTFINKKSKCNSIITKNKLDNDIILTEQELSLHNLFYPHTKKFLNQLIKEINANIVFTDMLYLKNYLDNMLQKDKEILNGDDLFDKITEYSNKEIC